VAYHDELLAQAQSLAETSRPNQANLRRSVSSAYYAVFHLLIAEAVSNWDSPDVRAFLSRGFKHAIMKSASTRKLALRPSTDDLVAENIQIVASHFVELQDARNFADYDLSEDLNQKRFSQSNAQRTFSHCGRC
jgi:hypothetical protein